MLASNVVKDRSDIFLKVEKYLKDNLSSYGYKVVTGGIPDSLEPERESGLVVPYVVLMFSSNDTIKKNMASSRNNTFIVTVDIIAVALSQHDADKIADRVSDLMDGYTCDGRTEFEQDYKVQYHRSYGTVQTRPSRYSAMVSFEGFFSPVRKAG